MHTFIYDLKSIRVNDGLVEIIVVSKMSSKVVGSGVEASKELIFVNDCVVFAEPGVRPEVLMIIELSWQTEVVADVV